MNTFDIIIVGAGSSGCVIANRLSESGRDHVLLIEAGGGFNDPLILMPKGFGRLMNDPTRAWRWTAERVVDGQPQGTENWIRGKALGGSSSINGMIYSRGHWQDYEDWKSYAGPLWGWEEMKRAFVAVEDHELPATDFRGRGGALKVRPGKYRYPLAENFIKAGEEMGLPRKADLNEPDHEGIGYYNYTIDRGRRFSSAHAFLKPALARKNLTVITGLEVDRILFEGRRAVGVKGRLDGRSVEYRCGKSVVVCAGTVNSPVLLQRSGIGPGRMLKEAGIDVLIDSPDVGARLREHLGFAMPHRLRGEASLNWRLRWPGLALGVLQYGLFHSGILAAGPYEIGAFARTDPSLPRPDIQIYLGAISTGKPVAGMPPTSIPIDPLPGFTISCHALRLKSESSIRVTSPNPEVPPSIRANWLELAEDQKTMLAMVKYMRRFVTMPALSPYVEEELVPGAAVKGDDALLDAIKRLLTNGIHATGTCRMGTDDGSVVDPKLLVRGTENVRVVDCSIMPSLISGNTNAPAIAAAWRAADLWASEKI